MRITVLLVLTILGTQFPSVSAASPTLPAGTWWTLEGTYQWSLSGTGSHQGSYAETGNYTTKFLITSSDPNTMSIHIQNDGFWSCSGEGSVFKDVSCGPRTSGTWSSTRDYTIYTSTFLVQSFTRNGQARTGPVGHPVWVLTNPSKLTDGGTTPYLWFVPNNDATDDHPTDVQASVSTQQLSLKGSMVKAWVITYTGQVLGSYQNSAGVFEVGPETDSRQYDPVYGTVVGGSLNQRFDGTEPGGKGSWTNNYSENSQFADSSLTFTASATVNMEPSAGLYVTVDEVKYTSSQLPATFDWVIGTTHTLAIDSTIQGNGVRYVFVQWSDGSTDTSRSLTVTQDTTSTARYKTQYQLTVVSDIGGPEGSGWYDAGTQAAFSVSSPQPETGFMGTLGGKLVFQGWSGDSNAAGRSATIGMDGPKTVTATWTADNTQPYMVLAGLAAVIVIVAALVIFMRRKKVST